MNHEQQTTTGETPPQPPGSEREQLPTAQPKIWVGSLSDYNNGILHGDWIDAAQEPDEIQTDIDAVLRSSPWAAETGEPAEEWGIFDTDQFGTYQPGQYGDISWISAVAAGIRQHGLAYAAWAHHIDEPDLLSGFDEAYLGHYDSLHAYVEQLINDLGYDELLDRVVPSSIRPWVQINVAGTARDLEQGGDVFTAPADDGGVWVFDAR